MKTVIVYGSMTGNAERIAEQLASLLMQLLFLAQVLTLPGLAIATF